MTDVISSGQRVSLQYRLTLDDGSVVEDAMEAEPLVYVHGTGQMVPGLEKQLEGKRVGDECRLEVEAADAYGEYDPTAEQAVPRSQFPAEAEIRPGTSFQAEGPRGVVDVRVLKLEGQAVPSAQRVRRARWRHGGCQFTPRQPPRRLLCDRDSHRRRGRRNPLRPRQSHP